MGRRTQGAKFVKKFPHSLRLETSPQVDPDLFGFTLLEPQTIQERLDVEAGAAHNERNRSPVPYIFAKGSRISGKLTCTCCFVRILKIYTVVFDLSPF